MQYMKMLNLSMFKLIKHLTEKSKGLRWGTEYLYFFLLTFFTNKRVSFRIKQVKRQSTGSNGP